MRLLVRLLRALFGILLLAAALLWWAHAQGWLVWPPLSTWALTWPPRLPVLTQPQSAPLPPAPDPYAATPSAPAPAETTPSPSTPAVPAQPAPKPTPSKPKPPTPAAAQALPADIPNTVPRVPPPSTAQNSPKVRFSPPLPRSAAGWYALGQAASQAGDSHKAAQAFAQAAALSPLASYWRALADEQVKLRDYAAATRAYSAAINKYRQSGDDMTARALEHLAAPYRQTLQIHRILPKAGLPAPLTQLAKLEPARAIALGIYVGPKGVQGPWGKPARMAEQLRPFAVAFRYWKFSDAEDETVIFPGRFAQAARDNGMALHLALEPGMPLSQLSDPIILAFARAAKQAELPIFVRFASEMNDPQNDWSADPALYRQTFARVARILHQEAPNVAMVWMPMPGDLDKMAEYYPGPAAVDWAGLSLYSVPFENGDTSKPRLSAHPLDLIDGFYRRYAGRHPIQLSEYAASDRSGAAPKRDLSAFAAQQLREVYWGAWLNYPRLKNINWLDIDMHTADHNGKTQARRNDYRLFESSFGSGAKWKAFREVSAFPAFATSWKAAACTSCELPTARRWGSESAGQSLEGAIWLTTAQPVGGLKLTLDGQNVPIEQNLPHRFRLPPLSAGKHTLRVLVWDTQSRVLAQSEQVFVAK